jgi:hypothetical protein
MKNGIIMLCTIAFLAGCSSSSQPQSREKEKYQGREETKKLEGALAVGYDGTAIRKNVDNTLNKNDDHNQDLDKAIKSGAEWQQKPY